MLGAIIGDIIGSRFEFNPTNDYNFELFTDECTFTDDTICTIAVADAILKGKTYGESIHEWCRKYPNPMGGYGGNFRNWVMSNNPQPYGSFGNGSAMRVSPIGWWYETVEDIFGEARKSAECTHNHEFGITGAQAVAWAVHDCQQLRREKKGSPITKDDILWRGLDHAVMLYCEFPQNFKIDIENYRNRFDETCQGTVPPALWIILNSTGFEDAIRRAVSLGADADTIGAIVGSIAEALWGIPEWIKEKALTYLPEEMKAVIFDFRKRLNRLRKLTKRCQYFIVGNTCVTHEQTQEPYEIERQWANDLAKSYQYADKVKTEMAQRFPLNQWQAVADDYDLPLSLVGYIARHTLKPSHKSLRCLIKYLDKYYAMRKPQAAEKKETEQIKTAMFWKLFLGDFNKLLNGKNPMPDKSKIATIKTMETHPMEEEAGISEINLSMRIPQKDMDILKRGHIPEVMEDHWFMYCDEEHIRYFRSWTGAQVFEAHYKKSGEEYIIDKLKMSHSLAEFGVNGDRAGVALFVYLLVAETNGDADNAWEAYLHEWDKLNKKYPPKTT